MATTTVIALFFIIRAIDLLIAAIAPYFITYLGFFPYKELLDLSRLPPFLASFGNFDGTHYIKIASHGYENYEQAFFPLYPLLIRFTAPLFGHNVVVSGLIISWIFGALGMAIFTSYLSGVLTDKKRIRWAIIFLVSYPTSFFFGAIYGESLFFFLVASALWSLQKKHYTTAAITAALASSSRFAGIFLIIPFVIAVLTAHDKSRSIALKKHTLRNVALLISPIIGLAAYMLYLIATTGDALYFITVQPVFGAYRSTHIILLPQVIYRYLKIFITANHDFRYYVAVLEFGMFITMLSAVIAEIVILYKSFTKNNNWPRLGLALFSLAYILLPTLTGTLSSMPRYSLLALSAYVSFAGIPSKALRYLLAGIFGAVHVFTLAYFIQGYFIS